jgi:hypothetical protein
MHMKGAFRRGLFSLVIVTISILSVLTIPGFRTYTIGVGDTVVAASQSNTVTILAPNSAPTLDSRSISSTVSGANLSGSPPSVDPDIEYWYWTGITDNNGLSDIDHIDAFIFRSGATTGTFNETKSYEFKWVRKNGATPTGGACNPVSGCWYELGAGGWVGAGFTYLVSADSVVPTLTGGTKTGTWKFALKVSKIALDTFGFSTHWNFEGDVYDKSAATALRTGQLDQNLYISINPVGALNFGTIAGGQNNASLPSNPLPSTYTTNAIAGLQLLGSGDPTNQFGDSFPLANIYVGKTANAANNDGIKLAVSATSLYTSMQVQAGATRNMYWFVTTPDPFGAGTYTFVYTVNIIFQTYSN